MKEMTCGEVQEMLPAYLDEPGASLSIRRHLAGCDGCRSELARYETLSAQMPALAGHTAEPPAHLLSALVSIPTESSSLDGVKTHLTRNRNAYLRGAAVLVAGAAAGAVWRSRRRLVTA
ncbi:MAG TPA: zf-HC2 domain-containing protein [Actinomycetota bacterium]|nr:zf-HC2 domain-containing protein [Actinomycetota bacterium]